MPVHPGIPWRPQSLPSSRYCPSTEFPFKIIIIIIIVFVCAGCTCVLVAHVWKVEDTWGSLVSPSAVSVLGDWTEGASFGSKHWHLLSTCQPQLGLSINPHIAYFLRVNSYTWATAWEGLPFEPVMNAANLLSQDVRSYAPTMSVSNSIHTTSQRFTYLWRLQAWTSVVCFLAWELFFFFFILCPFRESDHPLSGMSRLTHCFEWIFHILKYGLLLGVKYRQTVTMDSFLQWLLRWCSQNYNFYAMFFNVLVIFFFVP